LTYIRGSTGGGGAWEFTGGVGFNNLLYLLKDLQAILVKYQRIISITLKKNSYQTNNNTGPEYQ
jgi:hypothetical protein